MSNSARCYSTFRVRDIEIKKTILASALCAITRPKHSRRNKNTSSKISVCSSGNPECLLLHMHIQVNSAEWAAT